MRASLSVGLLLLGLALGFLVGTFAQEFASVMWIEDVLNSTPEPDLDDFNHTPPVMVAFRGVAGLSAALAALWLLVAVVRKGR